MTPFTFRNWQAEALEEIEAATLTDTPDRAKRGVGRVTWARRKGSARVAWEKVARALDAPDRLIDEHTKITTGSRSFRFTEAKPAETTKEG